MLQKVILPAVVPSIMTGIRIGLGIGWMCIVAAEMVGVTSGGVGFYIWAMGDVGVGLMAWLNIIAIIILQKPALLCLKDYEEQLAEGKDPQFDSLKVGIKNADFWEGGYKHHPDYQKHKHNL